MKELLNGRLWKEKESDLQYADKRIYAFILTRVLDNQTSRCMSSYEVELYIGALLQLLNTFD